MKQYPRFLKSMPSFLGISFPELGIVLLSLWSCLILNLASYYALAGSLIGIVSYKIVKKNFDFVGFLVPMKKDMYLTDFRKEEE